jgi:hypothetical protein
MTTRQESLSAEEGDHAGAGVMRVRVDFDTTQGDQTYTTLKNSLPLVGLPSK